MSHYFVYSLHVLQQVLDQVHDSDALRRGVLITQTTRAVRADDELHGLVEPSVAAVR